MRLGYVLLTILFLCVKETVSFTVDSPFGRIRGQQVTHKNGQKYLSFSGIPYAKPPVGNLRFAKPEPHPKLDGVFDATNSNVMCPHPDLILQGAQQGSEDCLVVNIFAKQIDLQKGLKRVLVFIHGGGFYQGSSAKYIPGSFVTTHDVVVVTINYRLGVLGFLSTENEASPGNNGLWDQTLALQWVKDNIEAFGGSPDDITISGESAGGASVALLSISPKTKGLFTKVYLHSGTATSSYALDLSATRHALQMAKLAKCWDGDIDATIDLDQSKEIISCLRGVDISNFTSFGDFSICEAKFTPLFDGNFFPEDPHILLQNDAYLQSIGFHDRSYLVGVNSQEVAVYVSYSKIMQGMMMLSGYSQEQVENIWKGIMETTWDSYTRGRIGSNVQDDVSKRIRDFYERRNTNNLSVLDMMSDLSFLIPTFDFVNAIARHQDSKSWLIYFNHFPAFMKGEFRGSVHGLDLLYWFDVEPEQLDDMIHAGIEGDMDAGDEELKTLFSSMIAGFVKTGNPSWSIQDRLPSEWPKYDAVTAPYLNFDSKPKVLNHLEQSKRDLWFKDVPELLHKKHPHSEL